MSNKLIKNKSIVVRVEQNPKISINESVNALKETVKHMYIGGVFSISEKLNENRRWYPYTVLSGAIDRYVNETGIGNPQSSAYGEIMHPDYLEPNMREACLLVTEYAETETGIWKGKAKILNTPSGKIIQTIVHDGGAFGVSTRGYGDIQEGRDKNLVSAIDLTAVDIVPKPSVSEAMMEQILESRLVNESLISKRLNCEILESANKIIKNTFIKEDRDKAMTNLVMRLFNSAGRK